MPRDALGVQSTRGTQEGFVALVVLSVVLVCVSISAL